MEVRAGKMEWEVSRRYSEFHNLYQTIKKHAKVKAEFPKKVYNPFVSSVHPSVIEERTIKLDIFLKEVVEIVKLTRNALLAFSFIKFIKLQGTPSKIKKHAMSIGGVRSSRVPQPTRTRVLLPL